MRNLVNMPGVSVSEPATKPQRYLDHSGRSRVVLRTVEDLDGRTVAYRRAKELRESIISDLTGCGNSDDLSAIKLALVEELAVLSAVIDDLNARLISGDPNADHRALVPLLNARRRTAALLGLERVAKDVTGNLELYLSQPNKGR